MRPTLIIRSVGSLAVLLALDLSVARAAEPTAGGPAATLMPQKTCPITGNAIDRRLSVDTAGYRFHVCSPGCIAQVKADPHKAADVLIARGEKPEIRLVVCPRCGEIQGTARCCDPKAGKCPKCGFNAGSPGCCRDLAGEARRLARKSGAAEGKSAPEMVLCPRCGELMGSEKCCRRGAERCPECGLQRGSPGCCKVSRLDLRGYGTDDVPYRPGYIRPKYEAPATSDRPTTP